MTKLAKEGLDLLAAFRAYDAAQEGMSPEEKESMDRQQIAGGTDFIVTEEELTKRRAEVRLDEVLTEGSTMSGKEAVEVMEEASKKNPFLGAVLRLWGRSEDGD